MKQTLLVLAAFLGLATAESAYNPIKSSVQILNLKNFEKQVTYNRDKGISVVQFYKSNEANSKRDVGQYEKFGLEHKGMFRIGAVECNEFKTICEKEGITEFPTYKIYPPIPAPVFNYDGGVDKELDTDKLKKMCYKYVGNRVIDITSANHETFKKENPNKPKMLLFTDKKSVPITYRALSTYFDKTLEFGMIKDTETDLINKYKVDKFPAFFLQKAGETKFTKYTGSGYSYFELFEFINIYSETFVFGNQNEQAASSNAASKPWLSTTLPYLSKDSANDICLKKDGTLCVIYVVADKSQSDPNLVTGLEKLKDQFTSKIERGITFSFMRLDASAEKDFASIFNIEASQLPAVVVLNPGKKARFLVSQKEHSAAGVSEQLDVILGGDARFTRIKDEKLPAFKNAHEFYQ